MGSKLKENILAHKLLSSSLVICILKMPVKAMVTVAMAEEAVFQFDEVDYYSWMLLINQVHPFVQMKILDVRYKLSLVWQKP